MSSETPSRLRVALVTTPPSIRSGIGDYTRHLLPYLREHVDVDLYVQRGADEPEWGDEKARLVDELDPRKYNQVLYQIGNESHHAFMAHMMRAIGGTAMQHDWVLFDMATTAYPGIARGGAKGHGLALREGGFDQARTYLANWKARRNGRKVPEDVSGAEALPGTILAGWHDPESNGRWVADCAVFRLPANGVTSVEIEAHVERGRSVELAQVAAGGKSVALVDGRATLELPKLDRPVLHVKTVGIAVTAEQRSHGDTRRLGSHISVIRWSDAAGQHELDLSAPSAHPIRPVDLSRDRFNLPFNRSIVRFADAFIVHSNYVKQNILRERNAITKVGVLQHGAECRWHDERRSETRRRMGLPKEWCDGFMISSFGGVQKHKRIEEALMALAKARETDSSIRMLLAGNMVTNDFDPQATAKALGIEDAVHFTGFVTEKDAWDWLHAGDVALNLRGPSSGGTSGGIFQAFSVGRFVLATDAAEQHELPDDVAIKIPMGGDEVDVLAAKMVELASNPELRKKYETAVRRYVEDECHWKHMARKYADYLSAFPRPNVGMRGVAKLRIVLNKLRAREEREAAK